MLYGQCVFDSIQPVKIRRTPILCDQVEKSHRYSKQSYPYQLYWRVWQALRRDHWNWWTSWSIGRGRRPQIHIDDGYCFLLTDENMELACAFSEEVESFCIRYGFSPPFFFSPSHFVKLLFLFFFFVIKSWIPYFFVFPCDLANLMKWRHVSKCNYHKLISAD
jgi:hypothetical protein